MALAEVVEVCELKGRARPDRRTRRTRRMYEPCCDATSEGMPAKISRVKAISPSVMVSNSPFSEELALLLNMGAVAMFPRRCSNDAMSARWWFK